MGAKWNPNLDFVVVGRDAGSAHEPGYGCGISSCVSGILLIDDLQDMESSRLFVSASLLTFYVCEDELWVARELLPTDHSTDRTADKIDM
jgi:hypothetical protein